jgi:hypothetical protein
MQFQLSLTAKLLMNAVHVSRNLQVITEAAKQAAAEI